MVDFYANVLTDYRAGLARTFGFTRRHFYNRSSTIFLNYYGNHGYSFYLDRRVVSVLCADFGRQQIDLLNRLIRATIGRTFSEEGRMIRCRVARIILLIIERGVIFIRRVRSKRLLFLIFYRNGSEFVVIKRERMDAFYDVDQRFGQERRLLSFHFSTIRVSITRCRGALLI